MYYGVSLKASNLGLKRPYDLEFVNLRTGNKLLTGAVYNNKSDMRSHSYETDRLSSNLADDSFRLWFARLCPTIGITRSNELNGNVKAEDLHNKSITDNQVALTNELYEALELFRLKGEEFKETCPVPVESIVIEIDESSKLNDHLVELGYKKIGSLYGEGAKVTFNYYFTRLN